MKKTGLKAVLAGGGTGGHVFPAIAIADEVVRRGGTARFIGSPDRLEATLVPKAGFGIDFIKVKPLVGVNVAGVFGSLVSIPFAIAKATALIKRLKPDVVLGVGGYVAGPAVLAAKMCGVKAALLEQNAAVGLTNKLLSRVVDTAFVSYEETLKSFPKGKAELTGNPVRQSIVEASKGEKKHREGLMHILVMGGSQGARAIDERTPIALKEAGLEKEVKIFHQCFRNDLESVTMAYQNLGIEATVCAFIEDMGKAYSEADLVIARSGATTVTELTAMGLPAVLLPYPHHSDMQQRHNAEPMERAGAAIVLDETKTSAMDLGQAIADFVRNEDKRIKAALASASLGRPLAATTIAMALEALAGAKS